ncbi:DUF1028 domain-containing protein [Lutimonas zeaxanthinifaciens]|uniref:DUF1028 domain-containing protein n=1 Tax=Lutimonas zeaxanthinifaciens TaxID=3060215 RepID=UPI00265C9602|nr:DUF1028 domain-containing protein [Lutimonas sp. YSD2104]WKK67183.1 DUF1028 domain-containing protein [Lutimonas sp. YSD2104]
MKLTFLRFFAVLIVSGSSVELQAQTVYKDQFAHTFSIVARDARTGEMAVGVQSHWFSVGTIVSWGKSGVGVVATQSFVNPAYGPEGIALMEKGKNAEEALDFLVAQDEGRDVRQVAMLDVNGNVSAHTGKKCIASAGQITGKNYSVQANMMLNDQVVPAMAKAFEENANLPLADRVLAVLLAAQEAGGDIRGQQSAAIIVVHGDKVDQPWLDKKVDLRVDDHKEPLKEMKRLLKVHKAYDHLNKGDVAMEKADMAMALKEYAAAEAMFPNNLEMKYWKAVTLANNGRLEEAKPIFKEVFEKDENWRTLTKRLPDSGLLTISDTEIQGILDL